MSYGIGVVVPKCDLEKEQIRFDLCEWTLPMTVLFYPKECRESFIRWNKEFTDKKITSMNRLMTAPCDCVCIIDEEGNFEILQRDTSKMSHEPDILRYLND